jgi:SOS-response transcriptional repressor LexA
MATKADTMTNLERGEDTRKRIMKFIKDYWKKNGCAPSLTEIAEGVSLSTHNSVRTHLLVLQNEGKVAWQPGKMRTIRLVEAASVRTRPSRRAG